MTEPAPSEPNGPNSSGDLSAPSGDLSAPSPTWQRGTSDGSCESDAATGLEGRYRVKLYREGGRLGLAYRADREGLRVTAILVGSAADQWNRTADSDRMICVGDVIKQVNFKQVLEGASNPVIAGCEELVQEMREGPERCHLHLQKFGPRWHLEGITGECLDMIHSAAEFGMHLEKVMPAQLRAPDDEIISDSDLKKLSRSQFIMTLFFVAIPSAMVLACVSAMGLGFDLFDAFAASSMNMIGNGIISVFFIILVGMYIVDWHKWESKLQRGVTMVVVLYGMCLGGVVKCRMYPQAPLVIILFHIPVVIGILRATAFHMVSRSSFYRSVSLATCIVGVTVLTVWLAWMNIGAWDGIWRYDSDTKAALVARSSLLYQETRFDVNGRMRSIDFYWDCKAKKDTDFDMVFGAPVDNGYELTIAEKKDRAAKCGQVNLIWFLLWISPFIVFLTNTVIAVFCAINGTLMQAVDTSRAEKALKQFILSVAVLFLCMWVAASVAGASMRLTGTLMAFCGAALGALFIWMYFEVGATLISSALKQSAMMRTLVAFVTNDWFRACFVIAFNVGIPVMFGVEVVKHRVRRLRGEDTSMRWLTPEASMALEFFRTWRWVSIFIKANWLVIVYWTLSVGVAKITFVFLSWLNEELSSVPFIWVLVIFFVIGFTMFLLPPVPGIPVYITSGIIIAAQARTIDEAGGYAGGIVIAVAISFTLKIAAVCGQYTIGYYMGKSVKVQQLVMVDKVPTRAIERILVRRGLDAAKVAVLVGGPDWPTSVLCGILKLSLFQCCLGTVPVILVSAPCVLAGAFMAGPRTDLGEAGQSLWGALANTALAVSAFGQLASGVLAMYYIQATISKHADELGEHRLEHDHVQALTLAEQEYNDCYAEVTDWRDLPKFWFIFIKLSAILMTTSFFLFLLFDEVCFREFQVKDSISDPEGLNCNGNFGCAVVRIVKDDPPIGWGALLLFAVACTMHFVFLKYASNRARQLYRRKQAEGVIHGSGSMVTLFDHTYETTHI